MHKEKPHNSNNTSYDGQFKLNIPNNKTHAKRNGSRRDVLSNFVSETRTDVDNEKGSHYVNYSDNAHVLGSSRDNRFSYDFDESTLKKENNYNAIALQDTDTFIDIKYREEHAQPIKYPELFSFAAERIEFYDELIEDLGEYLVETTNIQEMFYAALDEKREQTEESDEILLRFGFDIVKGANDVGNNSKRIRYSRELFQTIGKYFLIKFQNKESKMK